MWLRMMHPGLRDLGNESVMRVVARVEDLFQFHVFSCCKTDMNRVLTCARIQTFSLRAAGKATKLKSSFDVREKIICKVCVLRKHL